MFGNWWHKKERPLLGLTGLMGGNSSGLISGAKEGKFTVNGGSERPAKDGYESPVTVVGGQHISIEVTAGPFVATVKMWGGGGGVGPEGGISGGGGFIQGDFDFQEGAPYQFVKGGGGKRWNEGPQPYGGGGDGTGPTNAFPGGRGGGGGGYSGFFKAPAPTPAANTRAQDYCILMCGGAGGAGGTTGESGQPGFGKWHMHQKGGSGGSAMPPADPPYGPPSGKYGGGNPTDPTEPHYPLRGQPGYNGAEGAPAPTASDPQGGYGGSRDGGYPTQPTSKGWGTALTGGAGAGKGPLYGGGTGGGGGYYGGGGGGHNTNPSTRPAAGGGGFVTIPTVHPEGISCPGPSITGAIGMRENQVNNFNSGNPVPAPQYSKGDPIWNPVFHAGNPSDPDRGDAGNGAMYGGPNYQPYTDANAAGNSGKIVVKQS